jgi:hypothetical protein
MSQEPERSAAKTKVPPGAAGGASADLSVWGAIREAMGFTASCEGDPGA